MLMMLILVISDAFNWPHLSANEQLSVGYYSAVHKTGIHGSQSDLA